MGPPLAPTLGSTQAPGALANIPVEGLHSERTVGREEDEIAV